MAVVKQGKNKNHPGNIKNIAPYMFRPGQSGNPNGRPKGKTLKEYASDMLACMTDEERQEYFKGIPKEVIWKMAEGSPKLDTNAEVSGELTVKIVHYGDTDTP